jgi:hypothetical protein
VRTCDELKVLLAYDDGRGVDFLQRMREPWPNAIRFLVLVSARREEIAKAINDAAIYQVIMAPWEPEQISLMLERARESCELARIHRYLSRELKFADSVLHRGRDLRHLRFGTGQPVADLAGGRGQVARNRPDPSGQRPDHRGEQPAANPTRRSRLFPARPVLSAARRKQ